MGSFFSGSSQLTNKMADRLREPRDAKILPVFLGAPLPPPLSVKLREKLHSTRFVREQRLRQDSFLRRYRCFLLSQPLYNPAGGPGRPTALRAVSRPQPRGRAGGRQGPARLPAPSQPGRRRAWRPSPSPPPPPSPGRGYFHAAVGSAGHER